MSINKFAYWSHVTFFLTCSLLPNLSAAQPEFFFTPTADLPAATAAHTATVLKNGNILVTGGYGKLFGRLPVASNLILGDRNIAVPESGGRDGVPADFGTCLEMESRAPSPPPSGRGRNYCSAPDSPNAVMWWQRPDVSTFELAPISANSRRRF